MLYGIDLGVIDSYMHAIVLVQVISIIWEFNLFLETDVYLFISDLLKMDNLRNDSLKYMHSHLKKIKGRFSRLFIAAPIKLFSSYSQSSSVDDLRFFNKQEKRELAYYCLMMALGFVFIMLQFLFLSIPREIVFITGSIKGILEAIKYTDLTLLLKQATLLFTYIPVFFVNLYKN